MNDDEKRQPAQASPGGGQATKNELASKAELATKAKCPQCGRPVVLAYRPFCSKRCADIDLSRWLNGVYAVPGRSTEDEDEEQD